MTQVNVKSSGKRSEVETLQCTGLCNGEDLASSSSRSLTRVSPSCQIHIAKPKSSSCFSTTESTCYSKIAAYPLDSSPSRTGKWNKIQLAASCFSWAKKRALWPQLWWHQDDKASHTVSLLEFFPSLTLSEMPHDYNHSLHTILKTFLCKYFMYLKHMNPCSFSVVKVYIYQAL